MPTLIGKSFANLLLQDQGLLELYEQRLLKVSVLLLIAARIVAGNCDEDVIREAAA